MAEAEIIHKAVGIFGMSLGQQALFIICLIILYLIVCWILYKKGFLYDEDSGLILGDIPCELGYPSYVCCITLLFVICGSVVGGIGYAIYSLVKYIVCNW